MSVTPLTDSVRLGQKARERLLRIKKRTGLQHWNELCRLALCYSLRNPAMPHPPDKTGEGGIDMDWKTFAGPLGDELTLLVRYRAAKDGIDVTDREVLSEYFRRHLERGIVGMLSVRSLRDVVNID